MSVVHQLIVESCLACHKEKSSTWGILRLCDVWSKESEIELGYLLHVNCLSIMRAIQMTGESFN